MRDLTTKETTKPFVAVVDDDESVCRAISRLIRSFDMEAGTFTSGQELMDLVHSIRPPRIDCIVLDIQMPNLNGLDVQQQLVKSQNPIPVIFIIAHDEVGMREQTLAAGAVGFLRKPFSDELLIETLREALARGGEEDG